MMSDKMIIWIYLLVVCMVVVVVVVVGRCRYLEFRLLNLRDEYAIPFPYRGIGTTGTFRLIPLT